MSHLGGLEPLGLEEYDLPTQAAPAPRESEPPTSELPADATQMEENLGVEDLGVDDVLQTKVRRPQPKLDATRLLNPHRGYPFLLEHLKKIPYRGKGDEKRYLKKYVNTYLIWANRLWPKANFDDFTVLARKAGRDPRVRQYCRELIEEEKYGGAAGGAASDAPVRSRAAAHEPSAAGRDAAETSDAAAGLSAAGLSTAGLSTDGTRLRGEPSSGPAAPLAAPASPPRSAPAAPEAPASPPLDWAAADEDEDEAAGPNEDEEAAAMELYGDLDM